MLHVNSKLPLITGTSILLYVPPLNKGSGGGVGEGTSVRVVSDVLVLGVGTAGGDVGRTDGDVGRTDGRTDGDVGPGCNGTLV